MSFNQKIMCYIWKSNNSRKKKEIAKSNQEKKNNNKSEKVYLENKSKWFNKTKKKFFSIFEAFSPEKPLLNNNKTNTRKNDSQC